MNMQIVRVTRIERWSFIGACLALAGFAIAYLLGERTAGLFTTTVGCTLIVAYIFLNYQAEDFTPPPPSSKPFTVDEHERQVHKLWESQLDKLRSDGGFVYVVRDVDFTGYYKIGRSASVWRRFLEFTAKFPFQTYIVHVVAASDSHQLEAVLHQQFADKRIRGEWFDLTPEDVEWICHLKGGAA